MLGSELSAAIGKSCMMWYIYDVRTYVFFTNSSAQYYSISLQEELAAIVKSTAQNNNSRLYQHRHAHDNDSLNSTTASTAGIVANKR